MDSFEFNGVCARPRLTGRLRYRPLMAAGKSLDSALCSSPRFVPTPYYGNNVSRVRGLTGGVASKELFGDGSFGWELSATSVPISSRYASMATTPWGNARAIFIYGGIIKASILEHEMFPSASARCVPRELIDLIRFRGFYRFVVRIKKKQLKENDGCFLRLLFRFFFIIFKKKNKTLSRVSQTILLLLYKLHMD